MRRKTPISESRKPEVKSPVDVIGYYPVRGKAVIYLLLEYVNHALGAVMPYVGVVAYEEAFDRMVGLLVSGATDEALSVPLDCLSDTLGALWRMFEETAAEWAKGIMPPDALQANEEQLLGACALAVALEEILLSLRRLPPDEIDALLDERSDCDGLPCFGAIEGMSERIAQAVIDRMMPLTGSDSVL